MHHNRIDPTHKTGRDFAEVQKLGSKQYRPHPLEKQWACNATARNNRTTINSQIHNHNLYRTHNDNIGCAIYREEHWDNLCTVSSSHLILPVSECRRFWGSSSPAVWPDWSAVSWPAESLSRAAPSCLMVETVNRKKIVEEENFILILLWVKIFPFSPLLPFLSPLLPLSLSPLFFLSLSLSPSSFHYHHAMWENISTPLSHIVTRDRVLVQQSLDYTVAWHLATSGTYISATVESCSMPNTLSTLTLSDIPLLNQISEVHNFRSIQIILEPQKYYWACLSINMQIYTPTAHAPKWHSPYCTTMK